MVNFSGSTGLGLGLGLWIGLRLVLVLAFMRYGAKNEEIQPSSTLQPCSLFLESAVFS